MQIAYHLGAHVTDNDRLLRGLLKDKDRLLKAGTVVPGPGRYRALIRKTLNAAIRDPEATPDPEAILDSIIEEDTPRRLVLSAQNFLGVPQRTLMYNKLYSLVDKRLPALANLLPAEEVEFHLAIRNPASFVPALVASAKESSVDEVLHEVVPENLVWSDLIHRIRMACPKAQLIVWCNEDSPLIWQDILLSLAGLPADAEPMLGSHDLLAEIMSAEGLKRYLDYIQARAPMSQTQRVSVLSAFLDKFALDDAMEEDFDLPDWTAELAEKLTDNYEDDIQRIAAMSDVDLILP